LAVQLGKVENFIFLAKILFFDQKFIFWPKVYFLRKSLFFEEKFIF